MGARPVFPPSTVRMFPNQLSWSKSTKLAHTLWASFALALLSVTHVRACKVGWKGEIHQFNHENVDNMHEVQSVGEHIIPETRISVIWKELDITTDTNEAWPDAPLDKDGNKAHEYFHARFHGFIHIPKYGDYEFHLTSDDGAKLFIDGLQVIDNDGIQAANRKSKVEKLHKGFHIVEVLYYEWTGHTRLLLEWEWKGDNHDAPSGLSNGKQNLDGRWICHGTIPQPVKPRISRSKVIKKYLRGIATAACAG